jgi:hypothetical protein
VLSDSFSTLNFLNGNNVVVNNINDSNFLLPFLGDNFNREFQEATMNTAVIVDVEKSLFIP